MRITFTHTQHTMCMLRYPGEIWWENCMFFLTRMQQGYFCLPGKNWNGITENWNGVKFIHDEVFMQIWLGNVWMECFPYPFEGCFPCCVKGSCVALWNSTCYDVSSSIRDVEVLFVFLMDEARVIHFGNETGLATSVLVWRRRLLVNGSIDICSYGRISSRWSRN